MSNDNTTTYSIVDYIIYILYRPTPYSTNLGTIVYP